MAIGYRQSVLNDWRSRPTTIAVVFGVAFCLAYYNTGLLDVCEATIKLWKFFFSPLLAFTFFIYVYARTMAIRFAIRFGAIVLIASFAGQMVGYWKPYICFS